MEEANGRPHIRLTSLHIRGLKSIRKLNLPQDMLGNVDKIPNTLVIGGINGSGKTTLLEFIEGAVCLLAGQGSATHIYLQAEQAAADIAIGWAKARSIQSFRIGSEEFVRSESKPECINCVRLEKGEFDTSFTGNFFRTFRSCANNAQYFGNSDLPSIIYMPSVGRTLETPTSPSKRPGSREEKPQLIWRWRHQPQWDSSLEARIYNARFHDLNEKEEGRTDNANRFAIYEKHFRTFTEDRKSLAWFGRELFVKLQDGTKHGLNELSSGEKQAFLIICEIMDHWRPGSMILIDEPELHLHNTWLTRLWETLCNLVETEGGQLIVATQSSHLFKIAKPGTKLLLGTEDL